jgi:hypothetical protein
MVDSVTIRYMNKNFLSQPRSCGLTISNWSPKNVGWLCSALVFEHTLDNPDFRAEGTVNEFGIRGYGTKGMRIFDFGCMIEFFHIRDLHVWCFSRAWFGRSCIASQSGSHLTV